MAVGEMEASLERLAERMSREFPGWRFSRLNGAWKAVRTMSQMEANRRGLAMTVMEEPGEKDKRKSYRDFLEELGKEREREERGDDEE